ncbi:Ger(x)C family spore germination protein [Paenibacillus sedimenti]|uniref:Ger(X)C family spore germination protein n=1 Tax=Paenibacillus sedimenti TaxID=2770274 RepID=A0A926KVI0_9BACL|nr:Ger(x)C family spore germination protein [Paenibacillus sedimenti]MBD0384078.1 Ger(x)C family spore germination protein [Paenibacillus sedimenti]
MMLGKKAQFCLFLCLVLSMPLLAGCWNRKEVNQIFFVSAGGIEKKENKVRLTIQFLRPKEKEQQKKESSAITLTTQGETIFEALRLLNLRVSRKGFWSHAYAIVLSEEIAKEGILPYLDLFRRDHEMRQDMVLIITDKPEQLLRSVPNIEMVLARELKDSMKGGSKFAGIPVFSTLHEVAKMLYSKSPYAAITHVTVDEKSKKFRIDGVSFFQKDRMVGTFKEKDVSGWHWLTGDIKSTIITLPCDKQKKTAAANLSIEIIRATSKLEVIRENRRLTLKVKVKAQSNVGENGCKSDLKKEEEFLRLGKLTSDKVGKIIEHMFDYAQKTIKTDVFGFGSVYYQQYPKSWKTIKPDWNELFSNAEKEIEVDVKVIGSGLIFSEKIGE